MQADLASIVGDALNDIAQSRLRAQETRRLLSGSRYRVAASRRYLNPAFAIAGGSESEGEENALSIERYQWG